jgi:flagellar L-ring protein precursor FlgH
MNRKTIFVALVMIPAWAGSDSLQAGSIWAKRSKTLQNLYVDDVARHIGDVLTIKISEGSKQDNTAQRDLQKQNNMSSNFDGKLGIGKVLPTVPGFTTSATSDNELKTKGNVQDQRSFEDQVTVVVVDILANGNLVVTGTRDRDIAGDVQTIEVSGIVRPSDIAYDNTIKSQQVANFRIVTKNSGLSASYAEPGWLGKIANFLWPW